MPRKKNAATLPRDSGHRPPGATPSYADAGVDIEAGDKFIESIKPLCGQATRPEVIGGIGNFGGLFRLSSEKYRRPVLVAATDGVGTKLKLANELDVHDSIGIDLVAMCVNDILTHGAEPLFFLDYFACARLSPAVASEVVAGIVEGCKLANCALIGGETAEMPGMYAAGAYDLAGFAVGVAEENALCGARRVETGDALIALASNGVHSNGFSLVRKILDTNKVPLEQALGNTTLGEALLAPTHIYVSALLPAILNGKIHALAHITGGGLTGNLPRILDGDRSATVNLQSWTPPPVFEWLREAGNIDRREMLRVFNCGVGMVAAVVPAEAPAVIRAIKETGLAGWQVGEVVARRGNSPVVYV